MAEGVCLSPCEPVVMADRERHTELVTLPDGREWFVESYRPRLAVTEAVVRAAPFALPFAVGEWLDWLRCRNGWLVSIRSPRGLGRVRWWERAPDRDTASRRREDVANDLRTGRWP